MITTKGLAALAIGSMTLMGTGCLSQASTDETETLGELQSAVSYDTTMVKPVPTSFLFKKTENNLCCGGINQGGASCSTPCATPQGLITQQGYDKAFDYYRATGQDTLDTLDKWKNFFKFTKRLPGEAVSTFRKRANIVIYYNRTELGLGRELGCAQDGGNAIACYVTNYGDSFGSVHDLSQPDADGRSGLAYAVSGNSQPKNTVVISYDVRRELKEGDGKAVQFAAFGPDGKRIQKAQLDNYGARPIPQICMTCHGGIWDPDSRAQNGVTSPVGNYLGISRFARFLPLITSTVTFSGNSPYTLSEQEPAIKAVNEKAWRARGTGLTLRQRQLMRWLYTATAAYDNNPSMSIRRTGMMLDTLDWQIAGRQYAENAWPGGWSAKQAFYNGAVLPYCDTCHMAMDQSFDWKYLDGRLLSDDHIAFRTAQAGTMYLAFQSLLSATTAPNPSTIGGFLGVKTNSSGLGIFASRGELQMPHSEQTFERFWADTSNVGGYQCLSGPMGDCFTRELGIWPNGRAQPKAAGNSTGIDYAALAPTSDAECGQSLTTAAATSGVNAGRRMASLALPSPLSSTFINQCGDGCKASALCPGAETASNPAATRFPGARQECVPISSGSNFGNCVSCGRIGEQGCTQIGTGCDTTQPPLNPNCKVLPACHEGTLLFGFCGATDLTRLTGVTATQSTTDTFGAALAIDGNTSGSYTRTKTTDTAPWWKVDLGASRKVKKIILYNNTSCCFDNLGNFVVEASTDNLSFAAVPGGDFTGVFPTNSSSVSITIPKAVDARYVRVTRLIGGPPSNPSYTLLSLAEVTVMGW